MVRPGEGYPRSDAWGDAGRQSRAGWLGREVADWGGDTDAPPVALFEMLQVKM